MKAVSFGVLVIGLALALVFVIYRAHGPTSRPDEGYIVDITREIDASQGYEVRFVNHSWTRCISETRTGTLTARAGTDTFAAPDFTYPEETIGVTSPTFFGLRNSTWTYEEVESLKTVTLGTIRDYTYEDHVDQYVHENLGSDRLYMTKGNDALPRLSTAL
jgi:ABC-type amino acid transport substrate-binding protein